MKSLILAAGRGKRIDKITKIHNKCMIKINGKPVLEYHLESSIALGVSEIIIVVGYKADCITDFFGDVYQGVPIRYIYQHEQKGLVHAIELAKEHIDTDFILMLGDEFFIKARHQQLVQEFQQKDSFGVCGIVYEDEPAQISKTYSLIIGEHQEIHRLIEKPRRPFNKIKGTGVCVFKKEILDYIKYTPINYQRKEKELPGLVQEAVDDGEDIICFEFCDKYLNINQMEELEGFINKHEHLSLS